MSYKEIEGNLITLALEGKFDVIAHGVNCFCTQKSGLAPQMVEAFGTDKFDKEYFIYKGDYNKLGNIEYECYTLQDSKAIATIKHPESTDLTVINAYTQYKYGKYHSNGDGVDHPLDYNALKLCLKKINHIFKGKHIGLPQIGCGLAGGDWNIIKNIIQTTLVDCDVTIVIYKPE